MPLTELSLLALLKIIYQLVKIIRQEKIDILYTHSWSPVIGGYLAAKITNKILITIAHSNYQSPWQRYLIGLGRYVICPSQATARFLSTHSSIPFSKIKIIPRGIDINRFKFIDPQDKLQQTINIGIIGRLSPPKGHFIFFEAMKQVSLTVPNIKILVVGGAFSAGQFSYLNQLKALSSELELQDKTEFLGRRYDIPEIISQPDILVLATIDSESFGLVIIEAQAAGVPVVATRVGGPEEIIDDYRTGLLVAPKNSKEIVQAVLKIINDQNFSSFLAQNVYQKLKTKFILKIMADATLRVFEEALASR